jgi:hypothetical protein
MPVETGWGEPPPQMAGSLGDATADPDVDTEVDSDSGDRPSSFRLNPDRSAVLIDVRSTVGPLSFGTLGVTGTIQAAVTDGAVRTDITPSGRLTIDVSGLNSGNRLYDAELLRRIDARRYPTASVDLYECAEGGTASRYRLAGAVTFHGVTRSAEGTVHIDAMSNDRLMITGEQIFDIRDFAVPSPTVLMLRIFPDVRVRLHAEAEREA